MFCKHMTISLPLSDPYKQAEDATFKTFICKSLSSVVQKMWEKFHTKM